MSLVSVLSLTFGRRFVQQIALTLLIGQSPTELSGEDVASRAKSQLSHFGVAGKLRYEAVGQNPSSSVFRWGVTLIDSRSHAVYQCSLDPAGRLVSAYRGKESDSYLGQQRRPLTDSKRERLVSGWLKSTGTKEPTRLTSMVVDEKSTAHAVFSILRNGYKFVSYPRYEYDIGFNANTGEFLSFISKENPPAIDPTPAKLDKAAAIAALKRIYESEIAPKLVSERHLVRATYTLSTRDPELGYYLQKGQSRAILVWRLEFWSQQETSMGTHGGSNGMLINAVTGERIPTDVVP